MPKIPPFLLLLVFFFPIGSGYFAVKYSEYKIHKTIKRQIKKGVKDEDLLLLKIPKQTEDQEIDFERIHSKEFKYKGEFYDIVKSEKNGDTTNYWCIWDKEETALFANLHTLVNHALSANTQHQNKREIVKKNFDYYLNDVASSPVPKRQFVCLSYQIKRSHHKNLILVPLSPPPQLA